MPTTRRARTIRAGRQELWDLISDPAQLPRWWPDVARVEDASSLAWTQVLTTPKGKTVRADFTRVAAEEPHRLVWRQEVDETPFERILSASETQIELEDAGEEGTRVELRTRQRLRGMSRFGGFLLRRATRRKLDQALDGLAQAAGAP